MNQFRTPLGSINARSGERDIPRNWEYGVLAETRPVEASQTFSCTPIPLDTTRQLLMISCISVRNSNDNRIIDRHDLANLLILPTAGVPSKGNLVANCIDTMIVGLSMEESFKQHYDMWVILEDKGAHEKIRVPIHLDGCRFTYFSLESMGSTVCMVHQLVDVSDETDVFVEEQEFLFSVMEIQSRLFLSGHVPQPVHYVESKVILQPDEDVSCLTESTPAPGSRFDGSHSGKDMDDLSMVLREELRVMNSLVSKYETRNNNTSIASSMTLSSLIE